MVLIRRHDLARASLRPWTPPPKKTTVSISEVSGRTHVRDPEFWEKKKGKNTCRLLQNQRLARQLAGPHCTQRHVHLYRNQICADACQRRKGLATWIVFFVVGG